MTNDRIERCACADPGCVCGGECVEVAECYLQRIDLEDVTGTAMCSECAADALEVGLFVELACRPNEGLTSWHIDR